MRIKIGQSAHLDSVAQKYLAAANWVSEIVHKTKEVNSNSLSRRLYPSVRERFSTPSQLTCSLFRNVTASYKTAKSNGLWVRCSFKKPTLPVTFGRDFTRNSKGIKILGHVCDLKHPHIPDSGWRDSKIKKVGGIWYLMLAHLVDIPDVASSGSIVGVDMGIKRMLVATNSSNSKTFFFRGGALNHRRSCIRQARASIQSVGTRSSRRLLKRMSGKEAAVTGHLLHVASKALVRYAKSVGARKIVVENLTNIRDGSIKKGKSFRSKIHRWPFAEMRFKIEYKAASAGIGIESVSPRNTSRGCSSCGHISESNRNGLTFLCVKCGHKDDADRQASKNIRARSVSLALIADGTGSCNTPKSSEPLDIGRDILESPRRAAGVGSRLKPKGKT